MAVRHALLDLEGVTDAKVSYDDKRAVVRYEPTTVRPSAMVTAIEEVGFDATVIEDEGAEA